VLFRDLYQHMEWADSTVWRAVVASEGASADRRVRELLAHLHMTQRAFLDTWRRQPLQYRDKSSFADAREVLRYARDYYAALGSHIDSVRDDALEQPMVMPWAERFRPGAEPTTLRETLLQVPLHSTYHRGQVNTRIREVGGQPPLVDYIAWIWQGRPAPAWPN
jgi:uncharacterized damage-inducible protein DinB